MGAASCRSSRSSEQNQKKEDIKNITIGVFGLDNAGKTSAVKAIEGSRTKNVIPTINANTLTVSYPTTTKRDEKSQERIKIIDVSGQRNFRENSWPDYYGQIHGLIFVIDASEKKRIKENKNTLDELLDNDKLRDKPILILANKQDLRGALNDEDEIKEKLDIENLKIKHKIELCTAIPNKDKGEDSIRVGFSWLIKTIEENYTDINSRVNNANNSRRSKSFERKHGKSDESDNDDAVVYSKKRTISPPPLNKFNTDYRSTINSNRLPALDLHKTKTKTKTSGRETYSEDDDDDDVTNVHSHLRPVVSPVDTDNTYRNRLLNQSNTSTTNTFNKKKKLTGPSSSNKNATMKKSNDTEPKSYRASYEQFSEEAPFSSSIKKTTNTNDIISRPLTKSSITNDSTKRKLSPLVHDTKPYNSSSMSKGANYSDNDDDVKKYPSSLSTNKSLSTSKKLTSGVYGADDDDDDDDKINNKTNRRPFGTTPTTTTTTKKFQKYSDDDDEHDSLKKPTPKITKTFDSDDDDDNKKNNNNNKSYPSPSDRFNLNNDHRRITSKPPLSPSITTKRTNADDDFPSSTSKYGTGSKSNYDNHLSTLSKTTTRSTADDDNDRPSFTSKSNSTIPSKSRFEDDDDDKKYPSSLSTNKSLSTSKKLTSGVYGADDDDDDDDKINNKTNRRPFGTTPTTTTTTKKFQKYGDDDNENDSLKKTTPKITKNFDSDDDDDNDKKNNNNKSYPSPSDRFNLNNDHRRITSKPPLSPSITTKRTNADDFFPSSTSKYGTRSRYDNDYSTSSISKPTTHAKNDDDDDDDDDYKTKSKLKVPSKYNDDDDDDDYKSKLKSKVPSKYNDDDDLPSSSSKFGARSKYDNDYPTSTLSKPATHSKYSDDDNPLSLSKPVIRSKYGHDDRSPSPLRSTSVLKKSDDKVPLPSSKSTARSKYEDDDDDDHPTNSPKITSRSKVLDDEFPSSLKKNNYSSHEDDFSGKGGVRSRFGYDNFDSSKGGFNNARAGSASAHRFRPNTDYDT